MEAVRSSETLVNVYRATWVHISEGSTHYVIYLQMCICVQVPLTSRREKAGLGSSSAELQAVTDDPASERKKALWRKTQKRYQEIS
jgi:hypothetical protein